MCGGGGQNHPLLIPFVKSFVINNSKQSTNDLKTITTLSFLTFSEIFFNTSNIYQTCIYHIHNIYNINNTSNVFNHHYVLFCLLNLLNLLNLLSVLNRLNLFKLSSLSKLFSLLNLLKFLSFSSLLNIYIVNPFRELKELIIFTNKSFNTKNNFFKQNLIKRTKNKYQILIKE